MGNALLLFLLLISSAGSAWAGTFELSDPAADFFDEEKQQRIEQDRPQTSMTTELRCTVDTGTGACTCVDKVEGEGIDMAAGQCETLVRSVLDRKDSR